MTEQGSAGVTPRVLEPIKAAIAELQGAIEHLDPSEKFGRAYINAALKILRAAVRESVASVPAASPAPKLADRLRALEQKLYWSGLDALDGDFMPLATLLREAADALAVPAEQTPTICEDCGQPILDGQETARVCSIGRESRRVHRRCGKVAMAHGRPVETEMCHNCHRPKPKGETCFQCGVGPPIGSVPAASEEPKP